MAVADVQLRLEREAEICYPRIVLLCLTLFRKLPRRGGKALTAGKDRSMLAHN